MEQSYNRPPQHLAWHETLEIHELVAFQSIGLMKLKKAYREITDPELKEIYRQSIHALSKNISELLQFYPMAPGSDRFDEERVDKLPFYSGDLLGLAKTSVRNYAIAITETATDSVRIVLTKHLMGAIDLHAKIYQYMYKRGFYPSYNLNKLLKNDVNLANKALSEPI
ncbi:spore coat protein [Cytobacillus oceanisediminis]|uniref:spore coat protein n=1 Tax=Cytobacillus oceanisediminis TaxID=665099 RepID=UPI001C2446A5|nr:spore coat protein [Cytobacillus oceanisediminis]MBU8769635.1 spore coat protein [Cytobacillus oceanisediminis]